MGESKSDLLQGTLDLMVLKTLESIGPLHGYGIARRIEQASDRPNRPCGRGPCSVGGHRARELYSRATSGNGKTDGGAP